MPPKIKRDVQITISPEFLLAMREFYNQWAATNMNLIQMGQTNPRYNGHFMTALRLMPIVRGLSPSNREGLDYEITRFRVLAHSYTAFDVIEGPEPCTEEGQIQWLVGRTRHITATYYSNRNDIKGELGPYNVYIPMTMATSPQLRHLHMIPQRNLRAVARHYHHGIVTDESSARRNPLSYGTSNCWGDYQGPMNSLLNVPDLPELFRQLHRHLSTYGQLPPYTRLDFDTLTPGETHAPRY